MGEKNIDCDDRAQNFANRTAEKQACGLRGKQKRRSPKMWFAVSSVRVSGLTTTKSKAVKERPPDGRCARCSFSFRACSMPLSVKRASQSGWSGAGLSPENEQQ